MKKQYEKLMVAAMVVYAAMGTAQAQSFKLDDIKNTSGAGSNDLTATFTKGKSTLQSGIDLFLIGCAAVGIVLFAICVWGMYKASKEERESPKGAIAGVIVGAAMTIIPLLVGLTRNTIFA
ncbi:hypothetical protein [Cupriavidus sp. TMH.W2]|uniref:hypothetical protein n=1 Tax=Cupriavidus sp. TMH.W2 TaxID=3434465 RepID=UPI003D7724AC